MLEPAYVKPGSEAEEYLMELIKCTNTYDGVTVHFMIPVQEGGFCTAYEFTDEAYAHIKKYIHEKKHA